VTINVGATQQLTATPRDANNAPLTGRVVTWQSSNPAIASVNPNTGLVTGVAPGGPVTITATCEGQTATASVTVQLAPVATVTVAPSTGSVATGATLQLTATTRDVGGVVLTGRTVAWTTANAGIANVNANTGLVSGVAQGGPVTITATSEGKTGTAAITVTGPPATLVRVILLPDTVSLVAGGARTFNASGKMSDSSVQPISVNYTAAGGAITQQGHYVAGNTPGVYNVVAQAQGHPLADTSRVTILSAPPPGSYTLLAGNDWQSYSSTAALQAAGLFSSSNVSLEPDQTFGQVARILQHENCSLPGDQFGASPTHSAGFTASNQVWLRFRVRFSPGWTSAGPEPPGHDNSYKLIFMLWAGATQRFELQFANTSAMHYGVSIGGVTRQETPLPGATDWWGQNASPMWNSDEWWEIIMYYQKFTATTGQWRIWKRQLTVGRQIVNQAFLWDGWSILATSGTLPQAKSISLGANKNKCNPADQYIYWGPYEIVDGARFPNPFGVGP
jgi:hypothetical protein